MTQPAASDRVQRLCDVCGQLDDHPRHVQAVAPGFVGAVPDTDFLRGLPDGTPALAIAELMDPTTVVRHMDCCAAAGCSVCAQVASVTGGAKGDELVQHLTSGVVDGIAAGPADNATATDPAQEA